MTLGNAKGTDLHVQSPHGKPFSVQVKGATTKAGWYVAEPQPPVANFFILVYIPDESENLPPQFFVLEGKETVSLVAQDVPKYIEKHKVSHEVAEKKVHKGVDWKDAEPHKDRWDKLPP